MVNFAKVVMPILRVMEVVVAAGTSVTPTPVAVVISATGSVPLPSKRTVRAPPERSAGRLRSDQNRR